MTSGATGSAGPALTDAERAGYRFIVRTQPQADFEEPDWIVIVRRPDGRLLFPGAVDSTESAARARGLAVAERDRAQQRASADFPGPADPG